MPTWRARREEERLPTPVLRLVLAILVLLAANPGHAQQVLRVGTNLWPGYEPLYLAREIVTPDWNETIRLVEYPSATEVLRAFRNKALEAAGLTLDEVLLLRQDQVPVEVVLVMDISLGGDVIIARPDIASVKDLAGKKVAVESGALGAYLLTRALEIHDLSLQQIDIIHLDVSGHRKAFESGRVDAVVTFDPVRTQLLEAGGAEIFTSREMPGEVVDVLVVHADALAERPETVQRLLLGWFQALELFQREPYKAAQMMGKRLSLTPQQVLASYQGMRLPDIRENHRLLGGKTPDLAKTLNRLHRIMLQHDLLEHQVDINQLLSADSLPAP